MALEYVFGGNLVRVQDGVIEQFAQAITGSCRDLDRRRDVLEQFDEARTVEFAGE